ncbi:hypothetical protein [Alkalinema sp. FACHB-956]|uniref:hypothetical protein n=1 Tax=Alkalinema sp. FACHB-956 TaxID=2692768 RepID=UPI00168852F8|nr:hypothetical protein [Alkalinema sp. FACHB-956]MBD2327455.1 hypothetical protein [Alkalinema sp. FACHB-956]
MMVDFVAPTVPKDWLLTSVHQFLSQVNWEGIEAQPETLTSAGLSQSTTVDPNAPLPLTLTVSQFMTAVNWEGAVMVDVNARPTDLATLDDLLGDVGESNNQAPGFTLTDFSDLF